MPMSNLPPIRRATAQDGLTRAAIVAEWIEKSDWISRTITRPELEGVLTDSWSKRETYAIGTYGIPEIRMEWQA